MTPDLERAVRALEHAATDIVYASHTGYPEDVETVLRALRDPSPAVVEAMALTLPMEYGYGPKEYYLGVRRRHAIAAWRAGIDAILESKP